MAKQRQVLHFVSNWGDEYRIIKTETKYNPYRIYRYSYEYNSNGVLSKHRRLCEKYGDLRSCFYWLLQNERAF